MGYYTVRTETTLFTRVIAQPCLKYKRGCFKKLKHGCSN